jgi:hypothetical protein
MWKTSNMQSLCASQIESKNHIFKIARRCLLVLVCFYLVSCGSGNSGQGSANNSTPIPTVADYTAPGEAANLAQFEVGLRRPYLVKGRIDNYSDIFTQMELYKVPGVSVVAIHNGEIAWIKSYGYKKNVNTKHKI